MAMSSPGQNDAVDEGSTNVLSGHGYSKKLFDDMTRDLSLPPGKNMIGSPVKYFLATSFLSSL